MRLTIARWCWIAWLHSAMSYGRIQVEHIFTPEDLARQTGAWRGALYGMALHHPLAPLQRPHNRCPDVAGLYFVGGTTTPAAASLW